MKTKSKYTVGDFGLQVKRGVSGKGLFAGLEIPKEKCVIEYIGTELSDAEQYTVNSRYLFGIGKDRMINGNIKENTARYINHSCKPNCEAREWKGHMYIMSIKKIKPGEELTYDYGEEYFDAHIKLNGCRCVKCAIKVRK